MDEIPPDLIINFDQTGINYVLVSSWTMEKKGSKCVEIIGKDDKHQITAPLAGTANGNFLPEQLVYTGTTKRCLPAFKFPDDWNITCSHNHWGNEEFMFDYFPYCAKNVES